MAAAPASVIVKFVLYEKERTIDVQREKDQFHDIIFVQGGTTTDYRSIVYKTFAFIQVSTPKPCVQKLDISACCVSLCTLDSPSPFPHPSKPPPSLPSLPNALETPHPLHLDEAWLPVLLQGKSEHTSTLAALMAPQVHSADVLC